MQEHFPRIEIYTQTNEAPAPAERPLSTMPPDTKERPLGRRLHRPHVQRATYPLTNAEALLALPMRLLPYFRETQPLTTLGTWLELAAAPHLPAWGALFPRHLDGFFAVDVDDRDSFDTLIEYDRLAPARVEIVWLAPDRFYVNNVFHGVELDDLLTGITPVTDDVMEGSLQRFVRFSPVVQTRLRDGPRLPPTQKTAPALNDIVVIVALTPGSPGTHDFQYTLRFDGQVTSAEGIEKRLPHDRVAALLSAAPAPPSESATPAPPRRHVDDGQSAVLRVWHDGLLHWMLGDRANGPATPAITAYYSLAETTLSELYPHHDRRLFPLRR